MEKYVHDYMRDKAIACRAFVVWLGPGRTLNQVLHLKARLAQAMTYCKTESAFIRTSTFYHMLVIR